MTEPASTSAAQPHAAAPVREPGEVRWATGIDLGDSGIYLIQLRTGGGEPPTLASLAVDAGDGFAAPQRGAEEAESGRARIRSLRALLRRTSPRVTAAHVNVPGERAVVKILARPPGDEYDAAESLRVRHLSKGLPFAPGSARFRFAAKADPVDGGVRTGGPRVFGSAADGTDVDDRAAAVQGAGIAVHAVTPNAFALDTLVRAAGLASPGLALAVLDLRPDFATLSVHGPRTLEFCRELPIGVRELLGLRAADRTAAPLASGGDTPPGTPAAPPDVAQPETPQSAPAEAGREGAPAAGKPVPRLVQRLVGEVVRDLETFHQSEGSVRVEHVYVCGDRIADLLPALVDELHASVLDPWQAVRVPQELRREAAAHGPRLAVAVGLALQDRPVLDFLGVRGQRVNKLLALNRVVTFLAVAGAAFLLLAAFLERSASDGLHGRVAAAELQLAELQQPLRTAAAYERMRGRLTRVRPAPSPAVAPVIPYYGMLADLSNLLLDPRLAEKVGLRRLFLPPRSRSGPAGGADAGRPEVELLAALRATSPAEFENLRDMLLEVLAGSPFFENVRPAAPGEGPTAAGQPWSLRVICGLRLPK
ncbi:MAG: hypothetical protein HYZ53_01530 [Planctomycetes bacterium]|nr:hypothetical protein [Planctomycetota bacterium]